MSVRSYADFDKGMFSVHAPGTVIILLSSGFCLAAATTTAVVPVIAVDTGADAAVPEEKTGGAGGGKGSRFQHRCFFSSGSCTFLFSFPP